jgi:hypothetical protein
MSFQREERYIVLKLKHMSEADECSLREFLQFREMPTVECVVVESKWDNHTEAWESVQRLAEGRESLMDEIARLSGERDALAASLGVAKSLMSRLIDTPAYRGGPRPVIVQEFIDWAQGGDIHLANRDARMKAEALDSMAENAPMKYSGPTWQELKLEAQKYRRLAEGES